MSTTTKRNGPNPTAIDPPAIQSAGLGHRPGRSAGRSNTDGARARRRMRGLIAPAVSLLLAAGGIAALPGLALGAPFQRGDVFFASSGGVQEYSPSGQLVQTVPGTLGAGAMCFNPNGTRLVLPGVGLFDNSGNLLPSNWSSVPAGRCVADGFGHVYVATRRSLVWTITKYDIMGNVLHTLYPTSISGIGPFAIDLAPDECTAYYGDWAETPLNGVSVGIGRFNVCTNTQQPFFGGSSFVDDLRVLPYGEVLTTDDPYANLYDASGAGIRSYYPGGAIFQNGDSLRTLSLDPDGTSFWVCCTYVRSDPLPRPNKIFRFDINSGQLLASWNLGDPTSPNVMAVDSPPLVGNANVEGTVDSNTSGTAEAFSTRARYSGQMTRLHLYVDSSSTASQAVVGVYSDNYGHPGELQEEATISNLRAGSWNYVDAPSMPVTAGQAYWIAVLSPGGGGTIRFRDATSGSGSETSAQHKLTALPAKWSTGTVYADGQLSADGS
jgi:hypothetical protein